MNEDTKVVFAMKSSGGPSLRIQHKRIGQKILMYRYLFDTVCSYAVL